MSYVVNNHLDDLHVLSNKAVGPGKNPRINKRRAYVYSGGQSISYSLRKYFTLMFWSPVGNCFASSWHLIGALLLFFGHDLDVLWASIWHSFVLLLASYCHPVLVLVLSSCCHLIVILLSSCCSLGDLLSFSMNPIRVLFLLSWQVLVMYLTSWRPLDVPLACFQHVLCIL